MDEVVSPVKLKPDVKRRKLSIHQRKMFNMWWLWKAGKPEKPRYSHVH